MTIKSPETPPYSTTFGTTSRYTNIHREFVLDDPEKPIVTLSHVDWLAMEIDLDRW